SGGRPPRSESPSRRSRETEAGMDGKNREEHGRAPRANAPETPARPGDRAGRGPRESPKTRRSEIQKRNRPDPRLPHGRVPRSGERDRIRASGRSARHRPRTGRAEAGAFGREDLRDRRNGPRPEVEESRASHRDLGFETFGHAIENPDGRAPAHRL